MRLLKPLRIGPARRWMPFVLRRENQSCLETSRRITWTQSLYMRSTNTGDNTRSNHDIVLEVESEFAEFQPNVSEAELLKRR